MADWDFIGRIPDEIQQNALRAAQTQNQNVLAQDNLLKLQQNQATQNAFRDIGNNPNMRDPTTGLPTGTGVAHLFQAGAPQAGIDLAESLAKLSGEQQRSALYSRKLMEDRVNSFDQNVAGPLNQFVTSLQDQKISPADISNRVATEQKRLTDEWQNKYGVTDEERQRGFSRPWNNTWFWQSDTWRQRQKDIAAGYDKWMEDSTGAKFRFNKFLSQWEDGSGKPIPTPTQPIFEIGTKPLAQSSEALGTGANYTVRNPDGSMGVKMLFPPKKAGQKFTNPDMTPFVGEVLGKADSSDPNIPGNKLPDYIASYAAMREALGQPVTLSWGQSKYMSQIAEADVRRSMKNIGIKDDVQPTIADAEVAAANDAATKATSRGQAESIAQLSKQYGALRSFEGTAQRGANLVEQLAQKGVAGGAQLTNSIEQWAREKVLSDADVSAFRTALVPFRDEFARIMIGSPSTLSGQVTVFSQQDVEKYFGLNLPINQLMANINVARQDMQNREISNRNAIIDATSAIRSGGGVAPPPVNVSKSEGVLTSQSKLDISLDEAKKALGTNNAVRGPKGTLYKEGSKVYFFPPGKSKSDAVEVQ